MEFKDTPVGKGIRTAYQTLLGILPLLIAILSTPEVRDAANGVIPWTTAIVPILSGISAWYQNHKGL